MELSSSSPLLALSRPLWVVVVSHPDVEDWTLLQAEQGGDSFVLAFTDEDHARGAVIALGYLGKGKVLRVEPELCVELFTAMCQVRASGILLDFEPGTQRAAVAFRVVGNA